MEKERALYTKAEIDENVRVPAMVEQDLKRIISDRLEQCGMYFRVFSRTKSSASMERKFATKQYDHNRKLQDLIGVRINLYYDDDVSLCQYVMEQTFQVLEWSTSERNEDEFKPTKLNGVFMLPSYLKNQISPATWDMCIDETFEIQIKTIFFEGWHEIEHDMRYKGEELWDQYPGFSRYFNSILATLELCDKSIVTLFEDLGHDLYKSGQWTDMIRSHFRIKIADTPMYPELEEILTEDQTLTVDSLAKRIYKTPKKALLEQLLRRVRRIPINVNTIVALLNDSDFHDSRLTELFREKDVYNDGRDEILAASRHVQMKALSRHSVFKMRTWVDGSRIRDEEPVTDKVIFRRTSDAVYKWIVSKYGELFTDMPAIRCSWQEEVIGYRVQIAISDETLTMKMEVNHIDPEVGGRIWYSRASLAPDKDGHMILDVDNGYAEPISEKHVPQEMPGMFFSYPGYYKAIVDTIGVFNGIECGNRRRILKEEQVPELIRAIRDPDRGFPVVLIVSREDEEGMMDEDWLGQFRVSDFTRTVWRYTHVFTSYETVGRAVLDAFGLNTPGAASKLYIFWPDGSVDSYGPEDVANCSFGRHLEARGDARTYDIVHGGQAFYHKIVTDLRNYIVTG
ncbi:MAG: hypothetical protein K6A74_02145 [Lachnospiraceae bacterium]|nr:hypothetical protein [Lachnospiraceae bacterium]